MSSIQSLVEEKVDMIDTILTHSSFCVNVKEPEYQAILSSIGSTLTDLLSKQREEIENIIKDEIKLQELCLRQTVVSDDPAAVIRHSVAKNTYIEALKKIQSNK